MVSERKTEIKVGITTIISLAVFIWIMAWAKNFLVTTNDIVITIYFENVSGLEVDDDVTVSGLRMGFVKDIMLDKNIILVKISIDSHLDLRKDAEFWLVSVDLMGDKKIEIYPGNSNEKLDLSLIHTGRFQPDLSAMMETIGAIKSDLFTIVDDIKVSLRAINSYLTDDQVKTDFKTTLSNLHSLTNKLDVMLTENKENVSKIMENTSVLSEEARSFFDQNKDNLSSSIKNLNSVLAKSDSLMDQFNYFVSETKYEKNNLGKLLYDDTLMVSLTESMTKLKDISKLLLQQLQKDGIKVDASIW
jgi:phospholipid/cholesterol/gamma-HCH transport system substrate-binding protein